MILITYGTRPEYIKVKPLIDKLCEHKIPYKTLFTKQHKDIVDTRSDFSLDMSDYSDNRLNSILINCLKSPNTWFKDIEYIVVQGDTTSVLGLSLYAMNNKIKIIHLEAGLRTYDNNNPYPEELNRKIVSSICDIHLCPTESNKINLLKENIPSEKIYVVGNTVLDNLVQYKDKITYDDVVLVTLHRRENHVIVDKWFHMINNLAKENPNYKFIFPLHPNPNVLTHKNILTNVNVINPLSHEELISYLLISKLVITDSGGIQEECSFLNKKCLVCRKTTERPESLGTTSFLVENYEDLNKIFYEHINNYKVESQNCPFGEGNSSDKIVSILKKILNLTFD